MMREAVTEVAMEGETADWTTKMTWKKRSDEDEEMEENEEGKRGEEGYKRKRERREE